MPTTKRKPSLSRPAKGYSDAFDSFADEFGHSKDLPQGVSEILHVSSSFKRIVARLNKEYVSALDKELGKIEPLEPDDEGVLTKGSFAGRRTLTFNKEVPGNRFIRAGSFEISATGLAQTDVIWIKFPMARFDVPEHRGKAIPPLVAAIAHETVHAFHRVTSGKTDPSLSRKARADAFIEEEIATRKEEKAILDEILSPAKRKALAIAEKKANSVGVREEIENEIASIKLARAEVERDFVSGTKLTYLEMGVIGALIEDSLLKDKGTMRADIEQVKRVVFTQPIDVVLQTDFPRRLTEEPKTGLKVPFWTPFAELLLMRRIIEQHWAESGDDDREAILQLHKKVAFRDEVNYTPLP